MFDLSFAEIVLVVVVAAIFIGPKDLPVVIRAIARFARAARSLAKDIRKAFDELAEESGVKDIENEVRMIQGDDGKMYEAYDLGNSSSPSQGEDKGGG